MNKCADLYRHTIPIFDYDRSRPDLVGTGVFVRVGEHPFIVTAAHVLEARFKKTAFGYLSSDGFKIFGYDAMPILTAKAQSGERDPKLATYKDDLDLALIQPSPQIRDELIAHYRPFNLEQVQLASAPSWIVVSGWPARKNVYDARRRRCDFKTCFHIQCPVLGPEAVIKCGRNSDIHFALSANKKKDFAAIDGSHVNLPNLDGISGAGAWELMADERWSLAGLVVEDHPSKHMLLVIKVAHVWTLLRHWFEQAGESFLSVRLRV